MLPTKTLAMAALMAAPVLPLTVTVPAAAAGAATIQTATPAVVPHLSRHWWHCHTSARPCATHHPAPTTGARAEVLARARQALGRPYRYGAAGPYSFDCAGLVQWAYAGAGKRLPRTVAGLAQAGHRTSHPMPGDVLLYGTSHAVIVAAVRGNRVVETIAARHTGTVVAYQAPYTTAFQVRSYLA